MFGVEPTVYVAGSAMDETGGNGAIGAFAGVLALIVVGSGVNASLGLLNDKESADASNAIVAAERPPAGSSIASFANEFESEAKAAQAAAAAAAAEAAAAAAPAPEI